MMGGSSVCTKELVFKSMRRKTGHYVVNVIMGARFLSSLHVHGCVFMVYSALIKLIPCRLLSSFQLRF